MATSPRTFLIELYEEYLEDASFLYEQRLSLLKNPQISWLKIGEFESRAEACIDGLVIGGELALDVCLRRAVDGDLGETNTAVRVFCRQNRKDLFLKILEAIDETKSQSVADALKFEIPEDWESLLLEFLQSENINFRAIAVDVIGFRKIKAADKLISLLADEHPESLVKIIWALGRIGSSNLPRILSSTLNHKEPSVCIESLVSLLRQGESSIVPQYVEKIKNEPWSLIPLSLSGHRLVYEHLLDLMSREKLSPELFQSLGLLGYASAIPSLQKYLNHSEYSSAAAFALNQMTAANLKESVFIPDEFEEDELFDHEKEALKMGKPPLRADGRPFGSYVTRISQNITDWKKWWEKNEKNFDPQSRYRNGLLFSKDVLLADLWRESASVPERELINDELVIQYRFSSPFEPSMLVKEQIKILEKSPAQAFPDSKTVIESY